MAQDDNRKSTFGGADFGKISPPREQLDGETRILNLKLSFENALKLNLAIDECVRALNAYKLSTSAGKHAALHLAIHLDKGRITVSEGKL